jgi:hypothetical protein
LTRENVPRVSRRPAHFRRHTARCCRGKPGIPRPVKVPNADSHTGLPHVFERVHGDPSPDGHWISMLPGFPDGSYGWAQVGARLRNVPSPRLARPEYESTPG